MKKILGAVLIIALMLSGCAGDLSKPEAGFVFETEGVTIAMNGRMHPILNALGEPKALTEEPSCAFVGMDRTYYYGSFYIQTYPLEGEDYVAGLWFADDSVTTPEGIGLGSDRGQVEAASGSKGWNGSNAYVMTAGESRLTILMENDRVCGIRYDADIL